MASVKSLNVAAPIIDYIPAVARTAAVTNNGWIDMGQYEQIRIVIVPGTLSGGTLDTSVAQATSNSGGGSKSLSGKAITQVTTTLQAPIEIIIKASELDVNNGFRYVQLTCTATATVTFGVVIEGSDVRTSPQRANVSQSLSS